LAHLAQELAAFYRGKRVAITGHTGLKGSWLALWLRKMGAEVFGVALPPTSERSNFTASGLSSLVQSAFIDVRDAASLSTALTSFRPEIVFHLAAQAIVGTAYKDPTSTFAVNVMGSVNVLDFVRNSSSVRAVVMITSDKCYDNVEQIWGYRETDRLGGDDPYSASKACAELAIRTYTTSYFTKEGTPNVASTRAGNVVGGGDWSDFRLVPDCIRFLRDGKPIEIRSPRATRPWQFVMDPLTGYLLLGRSLWNDGKRSSGGWNFGPPVDNNNNVEKGAGEIVRCWGEGRIEIAPTALFHESTSLQLDCTKAHLHLGWRPMLDFSQTMLMTTAWYRQQFDTRDGAMREFTLGQIAEFERLLDGSSAS
jgi:CDP-glucose 4,6-dehydratase